MSANHSGNIDPHRQPHRNKDLPKAFAESKSDCDDQQNGGNRPHNVDKPHDNVVCLSSIVACNSSEAHSYKNSYQYRNQTYRKGNTSADNELRKHISAISVCAEKVGALNNPIITSVRQGYDFATVGIVSRI